MTRDPREIAIDVVEEVLKGADIQSSLNQYLCEYSIKRIDKKLITALCYGYLRLKKRINYVLKRTVKGSVKRLPPKLLIALGLGVYELLYLEKIPEYATIYWYVEYCKKKISRALSGLTNAVLRHISRIKDELLSERYYRHEDQKVFLSRFYSCPLWIVDLWFKSFGVKVCVELLKRSIEPPMVGIRLNPKKAEASKELVQKLSCFSKVSNFKFLGFGFEKTPPVDVEEMEQKGIITRQSFESQKILWDLNFFSWDPPIWDCCCGRGLKTTFLLEREVKDIFASDISQSRLSFLKKELTRLSLPEIVIFKADATQYIPKKTPETILIDAPCSGLGVLSRRPDIKWKRNPNELQRLKKLQKKLLVHALNLLKKGGKIVYITCTTNPQENEEVIRSLIDIKILKEISIKDSLNNPDIKEFFYGATIQKI